MKHVLVRATGALVLAVAVAGAALPAVAAGASSGPGVTSKTITIGYITSTTGVASSTFTDGPAGAMARIDEQNAKGGIDGRKLVLVTKDDTSSPTSNQTAAQELVQQDNAFGVVDFSAVAFGGAKYLNQQGVPVTGSEFDGPEWGMQPNSNMFTYSPPAYTPYNGKLYTNTYLGTFLKNIGVTKLASLAYGISPSAVDAAAGAVASAAAAGIKNCYQNYSVPFGAVDFTADVLAIKSSGCNGVQAPLVDSSDVALSTAVKQGGVTAKQLYYTGYSSDVSGKTASAAAFDGNYVVAGIDFVTPSASVAAMLNAFKRYDPKYTASDIPDLGLYGSYIATDLMIKGLQLAGKDPTRPTFIKNLRQVSSYDAGGILPSPVTFKGFGTLAMIPASGCTYIVQLKGSKFVTANGGSPVCGKRMSYTAPSS
jgi:branched-chain amino acid transport system substrate-binding protein